MRSSERSTGTSEEPIAKLEESSEKKRKKIELQPGMKLKFGISARRPEAGRASPKREIQAYSDYHDLLFFSLLSPHSIPNFLKPTSFSLKQPRWSKWTTEFENLRWLFLGLTHMVHRWPNSLGFEGQRPTVPSDGAVPGHGAHWCKHDRFNATEHLIGSNLEFEFLRRCHRLILLTLLTRLTVRDEIGQKSKQLMASRSELAQKRKFQISNLRRINKYVQKKTKFALI